MRVDGHNEAYGPQDRPGSPGCRENWGVPLVKRLTLLLVAEPGVVRDVRRGSALWRGRENAPKPKALGQDVKETLAKLTSGEVDSAFVYASDVKVNPAVLGVPLRSDGGNTLKASLQFPVGVVSGSPESKKFYDFLFSEPAKKALTDAGFELP